MMRICVFFCLALAVVATAEPISDTNPGRVGTDASGNVVVEPPQGKEVIIEGTEWSSVLSRLSKAEAALGIATGTTNPPGVNVIGDDVYITGKSVYLISPKSHAISETSSAWSPEVVSISVGDNVTWTWSSSEAVYQVNPADNVTRTGDISSGDAVIGGSYSYTFRTPGTYRIRGASKGYLATVIVSGFGITANNVIEASKWLQEGISGTSGGTEVTTGMAYENSYSYNCAVTSCVSGLTFTGTYPTQCVRCQSTPSALNVIFGFQYGGIVSSYYYWACQNTADQLKKMWSRSPSGSTPVDDYMCVGQL
jgi:hypothetical protein